MSALARTPVLPEATHVGALSAHLRLSLYAQQRSALDQKLSFSGAMGDDCLVRTTGQSPKELTCRSSVGECSNRITATVTKTAGLRFYRASLRECDMPHFRKPDRASVPLAICEPIFDPCALAPLGLATP